MARVRPSLPHLRYRYLSDSALPTSLSNSFFQEVRNRLTGLARPKHSSSTSSSDAESLSFSNEASSSSTIIGTPPTLYRSRTSVCSTRGPGSSVDDEEYVIREGINTRIVRDVLLYEEFARNSASNSGIQWQFANQALRYLSLSACESQPLSHLSTHESSSPSRQLYIHGVTHSIRGLPANLSNDEVISVWNALPAPLQEMGAVASTRTNNALLAVSQAHSSSQSPKLEQTPSILHRIVAFSIVQFFLLIQLISPYLRLIAISIARFEREGRISQKVLASGIWAINGTFRLGCHLCDLNEGKVGKALSEVGVWWMRGVSGGLRQGILEGLGLLEFDE